ncbi:hypothetical protein L6452_19174 [Arctium lappa]|uniref:Uncharacterized protein n=1 Tax=Arctium lappa TaxID=4217 RepID=A0ACB9B7Z0_ARCLA|nr:hypothetical protein L6452_19174 [Arctium lappa]
MKKKKEEKQREEPDDDKDMEIDEENEEYERHKVEKLNKVTEKLSKSKSLYETETESQSESESLGEEEEFEKDFKDDWTNMDEDYLEEENDALQIANVPEIDKETHRLAVVKLDWNQVQLLLRTVCHVKFNHCLNSLNSDKRIMLSVQLCIGPLFTGLRSRLPVGLMSEAAFYSHLGLLGLFEFDFGS